MPDTTYRVVLALSTEGTFNARMGELGARAETAQRSVRSLAISGREVGDVFSRVGERVGGFNTVVPVMTVLRPGPAADHATGANICGPEQPDHAGFALEESLAFGHVEHWEGPTAGIA